MELNAIGSLSAYTYQNTLNQTGSPSRAMAQNLASGQSQVADVVTLLGQEGSTDPKAAVDRSPSRLPLAKLYTPAPTSEGIGPSIEQNAHADAAGQKSPKASGLNLLA